MRHIIKSVKNDYDSWIYSNIIINVSGDLSAKFLHKVQPEKLAAYEWHFDTHSKADLVFLVS